MSPFRNEDDFTTTDFARTVGMTGAIGLGVGKWWQSTNFNQIIQDNKIPTNYQKAFYATQRALTEFGQFKSQTTRFNQVSLDNLMTAIDEEKLYLSSSDIKSALLRAAERHDPTDILAEKFAKQLDEGLSPVALLQDLKNATEGSSSIYAQRTLSGFLEDIGVLEERLIAGKSITPKAFPDIQIGQFRNISLEQLQGRGGFVNIIQQIEGKLKGRIVLKGWERGDKPGKQLAIQIYDSPYLPQATKGKGPQMTLRIPLSLSDQPGMVVHGATQQSKYIAGEFWLIDKLKDDWQLKKKMRYEEWAGRRFLERETQDIIQAHRLTRREVHRMEASFHQEITKPLEWVETIDPGLHAGQDEYIRMRQQIARLAAPGRDLTDIEYAEVIERGLIDEGTTGGHRKVFPAGSPVQMTRNIVSLTDWRNMSLFPEAADWARRPMQAIRREFTPTPVALEMIERNKLTQMYQWAARKEGAPSPMLRTLYAKSIHAPGLAKLGLNIEGSTFLSREKAALFSQEELVHYSISSEKALDLTDILQGQTKTSWKGEGEIIPKGSVLGYGPEGLPVTVDQPFHFLEATRYKDANKKDFIRMVGTKELRDMNWFKSFGDVKAMVGIVPQEKVDEAFRMTTGLNPIHQLPIHAATTIDELRKNRSLHYKQMFTALHEFTRQNMDTGLASTSFFRDPEKAIAGIRRIATQGDKFNHNIVLGEAMKLAREAYLSPEQMGMTFGAVPEVFGDAWPLGMKLSPEELLAIQRTSPVGLAQLAFGGKYGPGSGKMGTIEPRLFELLSSPHLGSFGPELQEDITKRMLHQYGYRLSEQETLAKAAASMLSPSGAAGVLPSQWTGELGQAGGLLNIPDVGDIQVPSAKTMSQLASYKTAAGIEVTPQLSVDYEQLIEDAKKFESGQMSKTSMMQSLNVTRQAVQKAQMETITGSESILRGRLFGSRFLTAVPEAHTAQLGIGRGEIGVSKPYLNQMLREMEELYGVEEAQELRRQVKAGKAGGLMMRHPFIGPYSAAPVGIKVIPGNEPIAVFGERFIKAGLLGEDFVGPTTGRTIRSLGAGVENLGALRFSPAVGMALDYDADIASLMLLPRKMGETARGMAATEGADAYSIRSQLLKAKKAATKSITMSEAAAGAALKLRIPKERLGLISESLQIARAGILANTRRMEGSRVGNALGLLEWLEQTPISGKHIAAGEEKTMLTLFSNIRRSISSRSKEKLMQNALAVVKQGGTGERFLRKGGRVALEEAEGLRFIDVPGINIEQASEDIMSSLGEFEKKGPGGISPARWRQIVRGRGKKGISPEEARAIPGFVRSMGPEASPFSGFFKTVDKPGTMAAVARRASSLRNRVASFGGRMLEHAKPVALGLGAALGIATVLSGPPRAMKMDLPRGQRMPRGGRGGEDISPNELAAQETQRRAMQGSPSVDNAMSATNRTPITPNSVAVSVRGKSGGNIDFSMLNSQVSRGLGNAQVNSRILDNRRSLSSQHLAKILRESE